MGTRLEELDRAGLELVLRSPVGEPVKDRARALLLVVDGGVSAGSSRENTSNGAGSGLVLDELRNSLPRLVHPADDDARHKAAPRTARQRPIDEELNQTERDFLDQVLSPRGRQVLAQRLTFRLAAGVSYRPDFAEVLPGGGLWLWEVKGSHTWDDARDRFKLAVELFPCWRWTMVARRRRGQPWRLVYDRGAFAADQALPEGIGG